jgi:xanthine/CO dehydrogenase XdhC/CoxF family maturation factor
MHQKQPPAKIAVLVAAGVVSARHTLALTSPTKAKSKEVKYFIIRLRV